MGFLDDVSEVGSNFQDVFVCTSVGEVAPHTHREFATDFQTSVVLLVAGKLVFNYAM